MPLPFMFERRNREHPASTEYRARNKARKSMVARILLVAPESATHQDAMDKLHALRSVNRREDVEFKIRWHGEKGILIKSSSEQGAADAANLAFTNNIDWDQKVLSE